MAYYLEGMLNLIDHHLRAAPALSLQSLSRLINVERHTIERAVRHARGGTFRQLRNSVMLDEATKLLRDQPHLTIKEIAFKLGYRSQSAFSRFLRTASGQSPTFIREIHHRGVNGTSANTPQVLHSHPKSVV